jgi:hypothetical protein
MNRSCRAFISAKRSQHGDTDAMETIESKHKDCLRLSKEKLDLANRAYDVVSKAFFFTSRKSILATTKIIAFRGGCELTNK